MRPLCCVFIATALGVVPCVDVGAQVTGSQALAQDLVKRLHGHPLRYFAAPVPSSESRFVAALHVPNVQLLVIAADYPTPALLRELILKGDYQRVYLDLNSAAPREGRFFVEDLGADGLKAEREENSAFDITWRNGSRRTLYDGNWKDQKFSEEEYRRRYARDADEYEKALQVLVEAHAAKSTMQERPQG